MITAPVHIVKVGGKIINDPALLESFLVSFCQLPQPKILVHGGGKKASQVSERMGLQVKMVDGRRITDKDTLEVAIMVYSGLINKQVVAMLQAMDTNAIGMTGADANLILANKRPVREIDFGFVGDIKAVAGPDLGMMLDQGLVPVVAPITHDGMGQLLNTNADTIASALGVEINTTREVTLSYCFEYKGVLKDLSQPDGETFHLIRSTAVEEMLQTGKVHSGMLPKLHNAIEASRSGVKTVSICGIQNLQCHTEATKILFDE